MNRSKLNILKINIFGLEWSIIIIHERLSFHFCNFIIKRVNRPFRTTIWQWFLVLPKIIELIKIMVIIWASISKSSYKTDYWTSLFFCIHISSAVDCWIKYVFIFTNICVVCFEYVYSCKWAVILILKT